VTDFLAGIALRGAGLARSVEPLPVSADPVTPLRALESGELERCARGSAPAANLPAREAAARPESPDESAEHSRQTSTRLGPDITASPADTQIGPPTARPTSSSVSDEQLPLLQQTDVTDVTSRQAWVTRRPAVTRTAGAPRVWRHPETGERRDDTATVVRGRPRRPDGAVRPESSIPDSTLGPGAPTLADGTRPEAAASLIQSPLASSVAPVVSPAPSVPIAMPLPPRQAHREEPAIEVRVGRVEIRAAAPPRPAPPVPRRAPRGFQERMPARRHADRRWY
jgi:hypothetical protein